MFGEHFCLHPSDPARIIIKPNKGTLSFFIRDEGNDHLIVRGDSSFVNTPFSVRAYRYCNLRRNFMNVKDLLVQAKRLIEQNKENERKKIQLTTKVEMLEKQIGEIEDNLKQEHDIDSIDELEKELKTLMTDIKVAIGLDGE